jgi:hypothetical protein
LLHSCCCLGSSPSLAEPRCCSCLLNESCLRVDQSSSSASYLPTSSPGHFFGEDPGLKWMSSRIEAGYHNFIRWHAGLLSRVRQEIALLEVQELPRNLVQDDWLLDFEEMNRFHGHRRWMHDSMKWIASGRRASAAGRARSGSSVCEHGHICRWRAHPRSWRVGEGRGALVR